MSDDRTPLAGIDPQLLDWHQGALDGDGAVCAAPQPGRPGFPCIGNKAFHADHRDVFGNSWSAREAAPVVAPVPRRYPDGSVIVTTSDAGDTRLVCPSWCTFQHGYRTPPALAEIAHHGDPVWALADTPEHGPTTLAEVALIQWPYSDEGAVRVAVETDDGNVETGPLGARRIAAALRRQADHLDAMATQAEALRGGEGQ